MDTHMGKPKDQEKEGIFSALVRLINNILEFFSKRRQNQEEELKLKEIEAAKTELKKALAEGRIDDAAFWRKKLMLLTGSLSVILLALSLTSGCITPPPPPPQVVVIGERINKVKPGETMVIPKLIPPAKQWYLVDDVGLYQWMDIKTP